MSMDLWEFANGDETEPPLSTPPTDDERTAHKAWKSSNLANIILPVKPSVREDIATLRNADTVWTRLKAHFDVIQPTTVFKDFKTAISIRIATGQ
jgi:hypothetical protein